MNDDWRSFEGIVRKHQSMVFSIALRIIGDRGTAEEVAQDVFLEMSRRMHRIESGEHATFWLRRVAVHRAIDAARRRARPPEISAEAIAASAECAWKDPLLARHLQQLVAELPEQMRAAIVLRYQEDLTPVEIAEILKTPVATVKSNLQRGLQRLRRKACGGLAQHHG